jgi:hypothetical protein
MIEITSGQQLILLRNGAGKLLTGLTILGEVG